jgi:hypothetical protein
MTLVGIVLVDQQGKCMHCYEMIAKWKDSSTIASKCGCLLGKKSVSIKAPAPIRTIYPLNQSSISISISVFVVAK